MFEPQTLEHSNNSISKTDHPTAKENKEEKKKGKKKRKNFVSNGSNAISTFISGVRKRLAQSPGRNAPRYARTARSAGFKADSSTRRSRKRRQAGDNANDTRAS